MKAFTAAAPACGQVGAPDYLLIECSISPGSQAGQESRANMINQNKSVPRTTTSLLPTRAANCGENKCRIS
jgi:hypothetical protein